MPDGRSSVFQGCISVKMKNLEEELGQVLQENGLTMGTAESCTGGSIASLVTSVSGSSSYFKGGIVSYAVSVKENLLGVPTETIEKYGVVSEETVAAMAYGAQEALDVDCVVATTGVAGPTGGTSENPVGTIWIGALYRNKLLTYRQEGDEGRGENVRRAVRNALMLLLQLVK